MAVRIVKIILDLKLIGDVNLKLEVLDEFIEMSNHIAENDTFVLAIVKGDIIGSFSEVVSRDITNELYFDVTFDVRDNNEKKVIATVKKVEKDESGNPVKEFEQSKLYIKEIITEDHTIREIVEFKGSKAKIIETETKEIEEIDEDDGTLIEAATLREIITRTRSLKINNSEIILGRIVRTRMDKSNNYTISEYIGENSLATNMKAEKVDSKGIKITEIRDDNGNVIKTVKVEGGFTIEEEIKNGENVITKIIEASMTLDEAGNIVSIENMNQGNLMMKDIFKSLTDKEQKNINDALEDINLVVARKVSRLFKSTSELELVIDKIANNELDVGNDKQGLINTYASKIKDVLGNAITQKKTKVMQTDQTLELKQGQLVIKHNLIKDISVLNGELKLNKSISAKNIQLSGQSKVEMNLEDTISGDTIKLAGKLTLNNDQTQRNSGPSLSLFLNS